MTRFGLALSAFRRHKGRTIFTVLSVAMAFAIFIVLAAINEGMTGHLSLAAARRLDTTTSINAPLPVAYAATIRSVQGVVAVSYTTFFGGYYRDPKQRVPVVAFAVPALFKVDPEIMAPPDQVQTFLHDRSGALIGAELAQSMGWHVGQTIPIEGGPTQANGSTTWYFHVDGIYTTDLPSGFQMVLTNYDYVNEGAVSSPRRDTVDDITVLVDDARNLDRVAHAIDSHFANSSPDTRTMTQQQETLSAMRQFGDIGAIITYVGLAVFASMLLITGNTMANSVRERMAEFAMMRALGFGRLQLAAIVFREAVIVIGAGACLGLLIGWVVSRLMSPIMVKVLQDFAVTWQALAAAAVLALFFSILTGLIPGQRVANMPVAATLRRA